MAEDKPRLVRLTKIITQLQSKSMVTARQIAEKHHVSIRTVYRDIRTLEQSGIPIITEEGRGYALMEGYKLPPVLFTAAEANALITAEQIIANNPDQSLVTTFGAALEKIKAVLKYSEKAKTEVLAKRIYVRNYNSEILKSDYLIQLQNAITAYQLIEITYVSLKDEKTKRTVEPFALIQTQENWLLIAFCTLKLDFRMFRLNRIARLICTQTNFEPHKITLQDFFEESKKKWKN